VGGSDGALHRRGDGEPDAGGGGHQRLEPHLHRVPRRARNLSATSHATEERMTALRARLDTDVLIVGAGPIGLFLANGCARRGLRCRLVETRSSQSAHSKALAIFPRTLEIFDMAGIVEPFLEAANRVTRVAIMTRGRTLARIPFAPEQSPYPFVAMVPQD